MPVQNKFETTNLQTNRRRAVAASAFLVSVIVGIAAIVGIVALSRNRADDTPPTDTVGASIIFGLPVASYTSILKNCSLTELQYNATMTRWESHKMVTLEAPLGSPVLATYAGTVTGVADHTLFGRQITIEHSDGLKTVYSNLDKNTLVSEGARVEKGTQIGSVGQTSNIEFTQIPHLRVEVFKNNKRIDPNDYIDFPIK